MNVWS